MSRGQQRRREVREVMGNGLARSGEPLGLLDVTDKTRVGPAFSRIMLYLGLRQPAVRSEPL